MSDDKTQNPPQGDSKARQLTAAEAAKRVKRTATEVLSWRDYGTHVVVVTRHGQKLSSQDE